MAWKIAWGYLPIHYNTTIGTVENITQRTFITNNLTGNKVKVKFSNLYGKEDLILEKVVIGQRKSKEDLIEQSIVLTHQNEERIIIHAGQEFYSDEMAWQVSAGSEIVVSLYIKEKTHIQSACSAWSNQIWTTIYGVDGDYTLEPQMEGKASLEIYPYVEADVNKANIMVGISEILIQTEAQVQTITLFGDSITHMSYFSDALSKILYKDYLGQVSIVNCGIGGNRVLHDATFFKEMPGEGKCFGIAGIKRFESNVFGTLTPEVVIILEGVNDLMHPYIFGCSEEIVTAKALQEGIENMVKLAKSKGTKVYLGTVMPFRNDEMPWLEEAEKVRNEYNEWIRNQTIADGFIDFDKVIRDNNKLQYMKEGTHIGDGLHPNEVGGMKMVEAIPVEYLVE